MANLDPNDQLDEFLRRAGDSFSRYSRLFAVTAGEVDEVQLRKGIAVDAAFRLGSEWETFLHRWEIAVLYKDPSKPIKLEENKVKAFEKTVPIPAGSILSVKVTYSVPKRLTANSVENLIDPDSRNIGFSNVAEWNKHAIKNFNPLYVAKTSAISSKVEDACVIDLLKAIRNHIAHGSGSSLHRLSQLVSVRIKGTSFGIFGAKNTAFLRGTNRILDPGTYLNASIDVLATKGMPSGTRVGLLHQRVIDIASGMRI